MTKTIENGIYKFSCDRCGKIAGISDNEQEALQIAKKVANIEKWEWHHPHWGLLCAKCNEEKKEEIGTFEYPSKIENTKKLSEMNDFEKREFFHQNGLNLLSYEDDGYRFSYFSAGSFVGIPDNIQKAVNEYNREKHPNNWR
jgi:hypothetical protein